MVKVLRKGGIVAANQIKTSGASRTATACNACTRGACHVARAWVPRGHMTTLIVADMRKKMVVECSSSRIKNCT